MKSKLILLFLLICLTSQGQIFNNVIFKNRVAFKGYTILKDTSLQFSNATDTGKISFHNDQWYFTPALSNLSGGGGISHPLNLSEIYSDSLLGAPVFSSGVPVQGEILRVNTSGEWANEFPDYIQSVYRIPGTDSVFMQRNASQYFAFKDSIGSVTASNLSTVGAAVFKQKVGNDLQFRKITSSTGFINPVVSGDSIRLDIQYTPVSISDLGQDISFDPTSQQFFPSYAAVVDYVAQADRYAILRIKQTGMTEPEAVVIYSNIDGFGISSTTRDHVGIYSITLADSYFTTYAASCISSVPFFSTNIGRTCGFAFESVDNSKLNFRIIDYEASAISVDDTQFYFYIRIDFKTAP